MQCHSTLRKRRWPSGLLAFALTLCVSHIGDASQAPWYLWRSKIESSYVCAQTSPGEGWQRASGPFVDAHCKKLKANSTVWPNT